MRILMSFPLLLCIFDYSVFAIDVGKPTKFLHQVVCQNIIDKGELVVYKECLSKDFSLTECTGKGDQEFLICGDDGTIRQVEDNQCVTIVSGFITVSKCDPSSDKNQIWTAEEISKDQVPTATWKIGGVSQKYYIFKHNGRQCMYNDESEQEKVTLRVCADILLKSRMSFRFHNRGKTLKQGQLKYEKNINCITAEGNKVILQNCFGGSKSDVNQNLIYYENGELRVKIDAGYNCLAPSKNLNMKIEFSVCKINSAEYLWSFTDCNGAKCSLINQESNKCITVPSDSNGQLSLQSCTYARNQQFEWTIGGFISIKVDYMKQACNENGKLEMAITEQVTYGHAEDKTLAAEVGASLESSLGVEVAGVSASATASVSTSVSKSLGKSWNFEKSGSKAVTIACDYYENDVKFNGGCMWQVKVTMRNIKYSEDLEWIPKIIKCTRDETPPECPPFFKCDGRCKECIPLREEPKKLRLKNKSQ